MLLYHFVLLISIQVILLNSKQCLCLSFGWGRNANRTCTPVHMLCSYSEQCCFGVCVHRVYMWVIKIKQCTMTDHLELLSPEEQLTYLQSAAIRDNITRLGGRLRMVQDPQDINPRHPLSLIRLDTDTTVAENRKGRKSSIEDSV